MLIAIPMATAITAHWLNLSSLSMILSTILITVFIAVVVEFVFYEIFYHYR